MIGASQLLFGAASGASATSVEFSIISAERVEEAPILIRRRNFTSAERFIIIYLFIHRIFSNYRPWRLFFIVQNMAEN
jgi:hypothetical protein